MKNSNAELNKYPTKKYPTIGVCGLDCGLCPRYYTVGSSRCPGCCGSGFFNKHPSCSFITCCVKKKNLEVCADCSDFPCSKFKSNEEYQQLKESSSYPSNKKIIRIKILETMIKNFDDGRSRSYFCRATCLLDPTSLQNSLNKSTEKIKSEKIKHNDVKKRTKILKTILNEIIQEE
jgi:hypothetical protein